MTTTQPIAGGDQAVAATPATRTKPRPVSTVVLTAIAVLIAMLFILPAVWILIGSFRPTEEIFSTMSPLSWHLLIPSQVTLDN